MFHILKDHPELKRSPSFWVTQTIVWVSFVIVCAYVFFDWKPFH